MGSIAGPWKNISSIWNILLDVDIDLNNASSAFLANGKNISFWLDSWADPVPFYLKFPDLFKAEKNKDCMVHDRMGQLMGLIGGMATTFGTDKWYWKYEGSGPKKVGIVAWRVEMERLPTKCALAALSIPVQSRSCVLCGNYDETSEHIFVSCQFAQMIWQNIAGWCMIPPIIAFDIKDLLTLHEISSGSSRKKKALCVVMLVTFWSIWKTRNEVVFEQTVPNTTKILDEIKAMTYLWVKNRSKMATLTWEDRSRFNVGG
ncbi:uncharacterized protein LOC110932099 [Helianthus annuus]|uniref:uncharacterized protein LOC110932099 n=1 Tax=Helianthus annuus TaxID=4232 RepID=UPI000B90005F|nr:uncharacterized protein LOC110932099 [Helianthus annuus]